MSSSSYSVDADAVARVPVKVRAPADPTATTVQFSFREVGATVGTSWVNGSWVSGSWVADTNGGTATALTPLLPGTGAAVELDPGRYVASVKFTLGGETPLEDIGLLAVLS